MFGNDLLELLRRNSSESAAAIGRRKKNKEFLVITRCSVHNSPPNIFFLYSSPHLVSYFFLFLQFFSFVVFFFSFHRLFPKNFAYTHTRHGLNIYLKTSRKMSIIQFLFILVFTSLNQANIQAKTTSIAKTLVNNHPKSNVNKK